MLQKNARNVHFNVPQMNFRVASIQERGEANEHVLLGGTMQMDDIPEMESGASINSDEQNDSDLDYINHGQETTTDFMKDIE